MELLKTNINDLARDKNTKMLLNMNMDRYNDILREREKASEMNIIKSDINFIKSELNNVRQLLDEITFLVKR